MLNTNNKYRLYTVNIKTWVRNFQRNFSSTEVQSQSYGTCVCRQLASSTAWEESQGSQQCQVKRTNMSGEVTSLFLQTYLYVLGANMSAAMLSLCLTTGLYCLKFSPTFLFKLVLLLTGNSTHCTHWIWIWTLSHPSSWITLLFLP